MGISIIMICPQNKMFLILRSDSYCRNTFQISITVSLSNHLKCFPLNSRSCQIASENKVVSVINGIIYHFKRYIWWTSRKDHKLKSYYVCNKVPSILSCGTTKSLLQTYEFTTSSVSYCEMINDKQCNVQRNDSQYYSVHFVYHGHLFVILQTP